MNVAGIYQQPQFVVGVATWSQQGGYTPIIFSKFQKKNFLFYYYIVYLHYGNKNTR